MFQKNNALFFQGHSYQQKGLNDEQKLKQVHERHETLHLFYQLLTEMVIVCIRKKIRLVIENPYTQPHYLTKYWCIKLSLIDKDRSESGDWMKKPTQYWFINFRPEHNPIFEPIVYVEKRNIERMKGSDRTRKRSEIHPQYARRFIKEHILTPEQLEIIEGR